VVSGPPFVRLRCELVAISRSTFPRRQQQLRLRRAATSGAAGLATGTLAVVAAHVGAIAIAAVLTVATAVLPVDSRRWLRLAGRSRVGARSVDHVQRALAALGAEGWRLRHSLRYPGGGDIDSVAIAPTGSRSRSRRRRARSRNATWPAPRKRRRGSTGIAGARAGGERSRCCAWCAHAESSTSKTEVLAVSLDPLAPALGASAGTSPRPAFLARKTSPRWVRSWLTTGSSASVAGAGAGGGVDEHAGEQEVCEAVGDRLGHTGCVAVQGADRHGRESAGLLARSPLHAHSLPSRQQGPRPATVQPRGRVLIYRPRGTLAQTAPLLGRAVAAPA
jgi:hypothetical protein